ncbi:MAG: putative bifunctional diguanylate cyclase/phosphodiesterase [Alphaproteobacteria bacterium]
MNIIMASSIAVSLGALAGAIYMVVRIKDWRLGLLTVMIALIAVQQISHIPSEPFEFSSFDLGGGKHLSQLGISLFAFLTPLFLERMIREQKRVQEALSASEARYRSVVESIRDVIFSTNAQGRWTFLNPSWEAITGFSVEESLGTDPLGFVHSEDRAAWQRTFEDLFHQRRSAARLQVRYLTKRDEECWLELHAQGVRDAAGRVSEVTGVLAHVTERRQQEARIQHLAHHDALTDLPNRTLFQAQLRLAIAQVKRRDGMVGVLFLDLDHFKDVNDTLGHAVGDELLKAVAARLTTGLIRETDTVARLGNTIARLGGDEFAVIATELTSVEGASAIARRIVAALAEPFHVAGHALRTGTTVGIALYPNDGKAPDELLKKADLALYAAKKAGRGTYHFYDREMEAALQGRKALEEELRRALQRAEFVLQFQPQVELATDRIVGFEALVRWHHPERGLISPAEFIPIAATSGLIQPLGDWVLKTACQQARAWQEEGRPPLSVAVNLSGAQFRSDLVSVVENALEDARLNPELLELEITETIMVRGRHAKVGATLARLSEIGVVISVDDFGTGYASLTYLRRFPVSKIKVDRSFVQGAIGNPDDAAIVRAVVGLARSLSKRVVAEGVETEEQLAFLVELGCDEAQGYYFGRPLSAEDSIALVRAQNAPVARGTQRLRSRMS